jgi:type I restriction enzyme M protein
MEFRNTGQTEAALKTKIQDLFDKAKKKWEGVFSEDAKISLSPSHLSVCVSSLENVKLFNSNLDVVDEAFEYLINKSSKGEKGQFFTPRYVIDMCVKMLNPQYDEYMIDTAAGSSGFPVHTIFHVWRQILEDEGLSASHLFSLEEKPPRCREYVQEQVFAIDFDEKAVRVARTLNLIAGDGETNVLHLNTLDYEMWDEVTGQEEWDDIYNSGFKRLKRQRPKGSKDYREFQFDVLMANPPFAGDIKETRIINHYDLPKKANGKWETKVGRDILFIERNLDFLKPGGRMAIVLPQGRFNNSSDKNIRDFIAERCRILAVVGLHGNTFKPHTGTKTSVLLVQKWNDDSKVGALCPRQDDYNIFFATMQKSGKDNSGEKIYVKNSDGSGDFLLDDHGHLIVDHDLFNHEGKTQDGIAEAFIEFAKKENFSFFKLSPSVAPFDAVKYQKLMDGLEATEASFKQVVEASYSSRIDSNFFQKEFLFSTLNNIKCWTLDQICIIRSGTTPLDRDENLKEGIILLKTNDIRNNVLVNYNTENYFFIDEVINQRMKQTQLKSEDVLINIVGATTDVIGRAALVAPEFPMANITQAMSLLRIKDNKSTDSHYLFAFLCSHYGNQQVRRIARPTGQFNMNLVEVGSIKLPFIKFDFQLKLRKIIIKSRSLIEQSKLIYKQAEDLLLSELNLKDWQPTTETIAIKSFKESFLFSGRLDAEYYQPKYDQLIERLKEKVELTRLGDLLNLNQRGKQPIYIESEDENELGLPVVNSKHVREGEVIMTDNRYAYFPETDNPLVIHTDDVLINGTGVGTIGRCAPYLYQQPALPDNHVTILRTDLLDSVYLSIYLNSIIGKLQVEKYFKGSSGQIELYPNEINQFLVWNAPKSVQKKIRNKVEESHQKREQSKQLLEIAKIGVEKAIETDEARATDWISQQLEILGIDLNNGGENKN